MRLPIDIIDNLTNIQLFWAIMQCFLMTFAIAYIYTLTNPREIMMYLSKVYMYVKTQNIDNV